MAHCDAGEREPSTPSAFMDRLAGRGMHTNKIVVASANKAARIAWAVLSKNVPFQPTAA